VQIEKNSTTFKKIQFSRHGRGNGGNGALDPWNLKFDVWLLKYLQKKCFSVSFAVGKIGHPLEESLLSPTPWKKSLDTHFGRADLQISN